MAGSIDSAISTQVYGVEAIQVHSNPPCQSPSPKRRQQDKPQCSSPWQYGSHRALQKNIAQSRAALPPRILSQMRLTRSATQSRPPCTWSLNHPKPSRPSSSPVLPVPFPVLSEVALDCAPCVGRGGRVGRSGSSGPSFRTGRCGPFNGWGVGDGGGSAGSAGMSSGLCVPAGFNGRRSVPLLGFGSMPMESARML